MANYDPNSEEYSFDCLLPRGEEDGDWHDMHELSVARRLCHNLNNGPSGPNIVEIHTDKEICNQAIEISGDAYIKFQLPQHSIHRYLTMHLKNVEKFLQVDITVIDEGTDGIPKKRIFKISNKGSQSVISNEVNEEGEDISVCKLPMSIKLGWQMCLLDLSELCQNAFGTFRPNAESVTVHGSCFVSKIFFHKDIISDAEMPSHLRAVLI